MTSKLFANRTIGLAFTLLDACKNGNPSPSSPQLPQTGSHCRESPVYGSSRSPTFAVPSPLPSAFLASTNDPKVASSGPGDAACWGLRASLPWGVQTTRVASCVHRRPGAPTPAMWT